MIKIIDLVCRGVVFDRDDCTELVRRNACGRRIDDADPAGRQRGLVSRLFGGFVGRVPQTCESATRAASVPAGTEDYVNLNLKIRAVSGAVESRAVGSERPGNRVRVVGPK